MITHRISTLNESDQIIVMHNGRVDSTGTHKKLMQKKGRYFALYQSQFGEPDNSMQPPIDRKTDETQQLDENV